MLTTHDDVVMKAGEPAASGKCGSGGGGDGEGGSDGGGGGGSGGCGGAPATHTRKPFEVSELSECHSIGPAVPNRFGPLLPLKLRPSKVKWSQQDSVLKVDAVNNPYSDSWIVQLSSLP